MCLGRGWKQVGVSGSQEVRGTQGFGPGGAGSRALKSGGPGVSPHFLKVVTPVLCQGQGRDTGEGQGLPHARITILANAKEGFQERTDSRGLCTVLETGQPSKRLAGFSAWFSRVRIGRGEPRTHHTGLTLSSSGSHICSSCFQRCVEGTHAHRFKCGHRSDAASRLTVRWEIAPALPEGTQWARWWWWCFLSRPHPVVIF